MRIDQQFAEPTIVAKRTTGGDVAWRLLLADGKPTCELASTRVIGNTALEAGKWYHVACTWDGSGLRVYLNGVQVGSISSQVSSVSRRFSPLRAFSSQRSERPASTPTTTSESETGDHAG